WTPCEGTPRDHNRMRCAWNLHSQYVRNRPGSARLAQSEGASTAPSETSPEGSAPAEPALETASSVRSELAPFPDRLLAGSGACRADKRVVETAVAGGGLRIPLLSRGVGLDALAVGRPGSGQTGRDAEGVAGEQRHAAARRLAFARERE